MRASVQLHDRLAAKTGPGAQINCKRCHRRHGRREPCPTPARDDAKK